MRDDTRDVRILIALIVAVIAIGAAVFGVVRGLSATGPGHGVRLHVSIAPPLDPRVVELATRVVEERCDEKGLDMRVVNGGDRVVAEIGEDDPEIVGHLVELIERRAVLEVHVVDPASAWQASLAAGARSDGLTIEAGIVTAADGKARGDHVLAAYLAQHPETTPPPSRTIAYGRTATRRWRPYVLEQTTVLAGSGITSADVASGGVAIGLSAPVSVTSGAQLAFVLDGIVTAVAPVDHVAPSDLHVQTQGATEDDAIKTATELVTAIEAGATPALKVTDRDSFTRATGFFPRAWPFFAIGAVMLLAAGLIARRRR